ncbi:MAG: ABC transporter permease [Desulfitobacteriia bacterium]|jgi:putative ABC transport system permease protein
MLFRKMVRDLKEQKGAYAACVVVIAIGLMVYTALSMVMDNLLLSQQTFYENQNFADGFVEVQAYPSNQVAKLAQIDGIAEIQGRLIKDVRVINPEEKSGNAALPFTNVEDNIYLRLVSMDTSQTSLINDVLLLEGIPLADDSLNLWVDNKFFEANSLQLNAELSLIIEGKKETFQVTGMGQSPEFIYAMRTTSELFPNPATFGIGYVPLEVMQSLFAEKTAVNNLVFTLEPGASFEEVKAYLEAELKPYGLKSIYPRKDQTSNLLLSQELTSLEATAKYMPLLFLAVAAMILYIMLKRMIELQRTQLGTLKAFGYTNFEIMFHYLSYALLTGLIGGLLGGLLGSALTEPFLSLYRQYFNMPGLEAAFSPGYFLMSLLLSTIFSLAAGYQGCRKILKLEPAEAMRPVAPPPGKKIILEKLAFFWQMLTVQGKMALRSMLRNKLRTAFLFLGMMFTFTLLALPWSFKNLADVMIFEQFEKIETYDVKIPLAVPLNQRAAEQELAGFPGVKNVEALAEVPVKLQNAWHEKDVILLGIKDGSTLYNIIDSSGNALDPPAGGVLISERLAQLLEAEPGTVLTVEGPLFENAEIKKELAVQGVIPQNVGINAYMEISSLQEFLGQGELATALLLSIEEESIPLLKEKYNDSMLINSIENRLSLLRQMQDLMASYSGMYYALFLFGIVIGFAIIYNTSVITLSERSRELASMMVLGMSPQEVLDVITFEQWFVSFFAMLAGIPLTKGFMAAMAEAIGNDVFAFTPEVNADAIIIAFLITTASIVFAQLMAARKLQRLSLVEVLKSRE